MNEKEIKSVIIILIAITIVSCDAKKNWKEIEDNAYHSVFNKIIDTLYQPYSTNEKANKEKIFVINDTLSYGLSPHPNDVSSYIKIDSDVLNGLTMDTVQNKINLRSIKKSGRFSFRYRSEIPAVIHRDFWTSAYALPAVVTLSKIRFNKTATIGCLYCMLSPVGNVRDTRSKAFFVIAKNKSNAEWEIREFHFERILY